MWMNPEINASDAFIVAWLPGSEGGAVADLLFSPLAGEPIYDFKGKLSFSWPNTAAQTAINRGPTNKALFPYGYGLNLSQVDTLGDDLQINPYPAGEIILPKRSLEVFKARPVTPFKAFAQSELGPMIELPNGVGETVKKVIKVNAIDFKLQEDGRLIKFSGEARGNYFFKTSTPINLDEIKLEKGNLHFNLKVSLNSPASFYILIGGLKIDYTDQLDTSDLNQWKQYQITRDELVKLGVDLNHLSQGFGIETEGAWEVGIAEVAFN